MNVRSSRSIATALTSSAGAGFLGVALVLGGTSLAVAGSGVAMVSAAPVITAPHPIAPLPPDPCHAGC